MPETSRAGLGFAGGLLAAVIGAGAGVAGAWAVSVIKPASLPVIQADGSLEQRLSAVQQELSVRMNGLAPKADVAALANRVTAVDQQLAGVAREARDLAARISATGTSAPLAAGASRQAAQTSSGAALDEALRAQITAMSERLTTLEKTTQQASAIAGEASNQVKALDGAVRNIDLSPAQAAVSAAAAATQRIAGLDGRIAELGRTVAARNADPRIADLARAVAASDALDAIRRGRPFRQENATLAAAEGDAVLTSRLSAGAGGVATLAQLQREFAAVRDKLAAMQHQNEGVLDRLTASASRLVRVRPVDQEGKPAAAAEGTVERVSDLLAAGDLAGAEAAWRALSQQQRDAASGFGVALTARVNAEQAARSALDAALASIARQGGNGNGVAPAQGNRP